MWTIKEKEMILVERNTLLFYRKMAIKNKKVI